MSAGAHEVKVGTTLPALEVRPTSISLMRFSAVTWNPHRIHYDEAYAATEGYPGVLVHGHLHGAWLLACVRRWAAALGRVEEFSWQNRHFAVPGDVLTITGEVAEVDGDRVVVALAETNAEGRLCAPGRAVVRLNPPEEDA